jgi:hypothetical protein
MSVFKGFQNYSLGLKNYGMYGFKIIETSTVHHRNNKIGG